MSSQTSSATRVQDLIDFNECDIFLETANQYTVKAYVDVCVNEKCSYSNPEQWFLVINKIFIIVASRTPYYYGE